MGAIGLNPIRLDRIGLDPIRINAIKLGVPGAASGTNRPYIDPEVLASLKAVCICYGKSNDDPDRAVVKNLVDPDNPFVISNAAYEGMSGYNGYPVVFGANKTWANESNGYVTSITSNTIHITNVLNAGLALLYSYVKYNGDLQNIKEIPPFKIEIKGLEGRSKFIYKYLATSDATKETNLYLENGTHELPKSFLPTEALINDAVVGFSISPIEEGVTNFLSDITIKVLPEYEGAFVTDGVDDLITSTKTVQEMLGGSNELTIVSMVHQVKDSANNVSFTNYIRGSANGYFRNIVNNYDKTGIYGYTSSDLKGLSVVNNILGDKNDYTSNGGNRDSIINGNFSVQGYSYNDGNNTGDFSSVAWYWTIIANKVLTTDQINQVIAYFNLDRTLKPDILCNITKQGITNDNHADFNDKLVDYSGNGRDIQMNNLAWKGGSGIAAKKFETIKDYLIVPDEGLQELTIYNEFSYKVKSIKHAARYWTVQSLNKTDVSYPITIIADKDIIWRNALNYTDENGVKGNIRKETNVPANTPTQVFVLGFNDFDVPDNYTKVNCVAYATRTDITEFTITFIPSCKGGILLDGINDFGKVIDMPIYKDYTFIIDRQIIFIGDTAGAVASKSEDSSDATKHGAFIFEYLGAPDNISTWSFYKDNSKVANTDFTRGISYQSKYSYNGKDLTVGTSKDSDKLWLGIIRDRDSRFFNGAIYSLMSFPYSMSKFLIERQLKKHKLGTLYPDMVEFRPIVKSNLPYSSISYSVNPGEYISVDSMVTITVTLPNTSDKLMEVSCNAISDISISGDNGVYEITGKIVKSPQKINLVISSYLTMLNNETLISNETLIKNE